MIEPSEGLEIIQMQRKGLLNYFLLFLLVGISGIPFFYTNPAHHYLLVILFLMSSILFLSKRNKFDKYFSIYLSIFIILSILQSITIKYISVISFIGLIIQIISAYFIIKIIGARFIEYYVNLIIFLTLVSFIIFLPSLFIPQFQTFIINNVAPLFSLPYEGPAIYKPQPSIILYTFNTSPAFQTSFLRNSGPFWEPGAFAGFIVIGLIFNSFKTKNIIEKKNVILIIGLLSTFSTTGYIALFFFIVSYNFFRRSHLKKFLIVPFLIVSFVLAFSNISFLNEKIEDDIHYSTHGNVNTIERTRFVSAFLDIKQFLEFPLQGTGKWYENIKDDDFSILQHRNNGVTDFLVKFGIIGFTLYFAGVYKTFSAYNFLFGKNKLNPLFHLILIFIIGFSEGYFFYMFFTSLTFLHLTVKQNKEIYYLHKIIYSERR